MWLDVYETPAYQDQSDPEAQKLSRELWEWTEKMQDDGRITQMDLIRFRRAIELSFRIGKRVGLEEVQDFAQEKRERTTDAD